ncbi:hypothetical protein HOV93_24180 [Planctomycetes bacterium FF15]|uniref:Uncharacterized protein n=1 Tax=Bremerella alba TaxID=980252 RepID=A0A7V8V5K3_9BACT|nr:hypothetical protein [Bremerella alba]
MGMGYGEELTSSRPLGDIKVVRRVCLGKADLFRMVGEQRDAIGTHLYGLSIETDDADSLSSSGSATSSFRCRIELTISNNGQPCLTACSLGLVGLKQDSSGRDRLTVEVNLPRDSIGV